MLTNSVINASSNNAAKRGVIGFPLIAAFAVTVVAARRREAQ